MLKRVGVIIVVAVVGLLGFSLPGGNLIAGGSVAASGTTLPCQTIGQMVVDAPTSHVFISCPTTDSVSVLDFSGNLVATISGIAGASGMTDAGGTVYVSAVNTGSVDAINTSTLAESPTGATGLVDPVDLVSAGGYLWSTTTGNDVPVSEPLYRIDPTTGAVTTYNSLLGSFVDALLADPGNSNKFLASSSVDYPPTVQFITVANGVPSAGTPVQPTNADNPLAFSPDGSSVFVQGVGNPNHVAALKASTLQPSGVQYLAPNPVTVIAASSGDGGVIAFNTAGVVIYRLGDPTDMIGSTEWTQGQVPETNGLAFSPDGTTIFVVTSAPFTGPGPAEFHALSTNALPAPPPFLTPYPYGGINFGAFPLGAVGERDVVLQNTGPGPAIISGATFSGANPDDFAADPSGCNPSPTGVITLAAQSGDCYLKVYFLPGALGSRRATMTLDDNESTPYSLNLSGVGTEGYFQASANGAVFAYGDARAAGGMSKSPLAAPIISMALTPDGGGYWLLGQDGGVFSFGDAAFFGSTGALHLNKPVVGMTSNPKGGGYWLVASDGGIFAFGDAPFYGSTGAIHLNKPIVGMASTPDGGGYWLVASDGGIFSFGDAPFYGSTGAIHLNKPIVGMASTPDGGGYWLVASDGGIFAFGDAPFYGSTGAIHLSKPIVGMASTPDGGGYWLTASDGGVFAFGGAPFYGSAASTLGQNVVGIISSDTPTLQATLDVPAVRAHQSQFPRWSSR